MARAVSLSDANQFTADLANELLGNHFGQTISSVRSSPLGEGVGLMSAIARAWLTLADGSERSVVFKYVAQTENASIAKGLNYYANELNFYRHLASDCPIPIPTAIYAHLEPDTQEFLLVLEDIVDVSPGDQLQGCDRALMSRAFQRAGELHGRYWGRTAEHDWLNYHNTVEQNLFRRDVVYQPGVAPTLERFGSLFTGRLEDTVVRIGEHFVEIFERAMSGTQTFIHGDYRTDNMLLPTVNGETDIITVDWQNSGGGKGPHDIAYFSSQSCGPELRGEIELAELRVYHDTLTGAGVRDYSFDECVRDYRLNLMATMITPVAVCGMLDQGNERGAELGRTMLERSLSALESMDCDGLLRELF